MPVMNQVNAETMPRRSEPPLNFTAGLTPGEWLRDVRLDKPLTGREVEEKTRELGVKRMVTQSYLSKIENNLQEISGVDKFKLEALRYIYGIDHAELERRTGVKIPSGARIQRQTSASVQLTGADLIIIVIPVLQSGRVIIDSIEVVVPAKYKNADLLAFYSDSQTIDGIELGRGVVIERGAKTQSSGEIVLVKALGKLLLTYALNADASRVVTSQGLEFAPDEIIGVMVSEIPRLAQDFRRKSQA